MTKKKEIKKAYDKISDQYNKNSKSQEDYLIEKFISNISKGDLILDAGCGARPFNTKNTTTVGLDISRKQLSKTKNISNLVQADISNVPFDSHTFDGLVAYHSLIHIPINQHKKACREFYRVLKNGSYGIITEGQNTWCGKNPNWLGTGNKMLWEIAGKDKTKQQLEDVGFKIKEIAEIKDNTNNKKSKGKPYFLVKKL